ncbi:MAG: diguanylate cyclase [Gallionella sp.]|nr:diguanylate cyclase [Gallionella sp.]
MTNTSATRPPKDHYLSASRLIAILVAAVFFAEALVMALLTMLPPMSEATKTVVDAALLSILLFPIFYFLVFRPLILHINERKASEDRMRLAANVFIHAREGILITDANGAIIEVNDTFSRITGYSRDEVLGKNPRILQSGRQSTEFYVEMWQAISQNRYWTGEIWNRRKNGEVYAEMLTISAVYDSDQSIQNYVALFSDITSMKEHQQELEHIAHYDALTDLPNRILLSDRLKHAMTQTQRRNQSLAVLFIDLDDFKAVNDLHGHEVGDELLITVSSRMRDALREGDTLARLGGDEFVAILVDLEQPQECEPILDRVLQAAAMPVMVGNTLLHVSASIGVAIYSQDNTDADLLLRHADQAMYQAKQTGRNKYCLYALPTEEAVRNFV